MSARAIAVSVLVLLGGLVPPAAAEHGGIHPTFRREQTYIHCSGPTKVENVNYQVSGQAPGWNTTPPSQSFTQGAGCGALDPGVIRAGGTSVLSPYDAALRGTFAGNLRDMTIQLHNLLLSRVRTGAATFTLRVKMSIDGEPLLGATDGRMVTLTPVLSSTGLSEYMEFSITNLGYAIDVLDEDGKVIDVLTGGLATEDGNGAAEHEVVIAVDTETSERNSAWVWDATEVPSGIVFNPTALAAAKMAADLPGGG